MSRQRDAVLGLVLRLSSGPWPMMSLDMYTHTWAHIKKMNSKLQSAKPINRKPIKPMKANIFGKAFVNTIKHTTKQKSCVCLLRTHTFSLSFLYSDHRKLKKKENMLILVVSAKYHFIIKLPRKEIKCWYNFSYKTKHTVLPYRELIPGIIVLSLRLSIFIFILESSPSILSLKPS